MELILPLDSHQLTLEIAGGKGVNLARLAQAGYPVPGGFVVTTEAYRSFVAHNQLDGFIRETLANTPMDNLEALERSSTEIRECFAAGSLPDHLAQALCQAYAAQGGSAVAVRSSATAEDLPEMSFAGQQDTFLNVVGESALLKAVVDCWSSLWTARATRYRFHNGLSQDGIALAVVVQRMIPSQASGILFTANPLSGLRTESVIDATLGLGEPLVSGHVDPDRYVVRNPRPGMPAALLSKKLGKKALVVHTKEGGGLSRVEGDADEVQALSDEQILALVQMSSQVASDFGSPQDIEWAWEAGRLVLLQARAITSLYPLPEDASPDPLWVMVSFGAVQGILDPITPLGLESICYLVAGAATMFGDHLTPSTQKEFLKAGERIFINVTPLLRNRLGRTLVHRALGVGEPGTQQYLDLLRDDPRLAPGRRIFRPGTVLLLARVFGPVVVRFPITLMNPDRMREGTMRRAEETLHRVQERGRTAQMLSDQLRLIDDVFRTIPGFMIRQVIPCFGPGMLMLYQLNHLAAQVPQGAQLALEITRGLPHNVTTQMDLALWETARLIQADADSEAFFENHDAPALALEYQAGHLPATAQTAVRRFLERYGARGIAEVDIGRPRWQDDPTPVMGSLLSYLRIRQPERAPDTVFARGAGAAEAALDRLVEALQRTSGGWLKAHLARWAAGRMRALAGLRELPKFLAVRLMAIIRQLLLSSGEKLAAARLLDKPDDIFFLGYDELNALAALQNEDGSWSSPVGSLAAGIPLTDLVAERRRRYDREKLRRQIPRLLLSDGRAFYEGLPTSGEAGHVVIHGDPVSPGVVEGKVRVVLDPHNAGLEPGEILVCRGTDPAWTPLFLAAGGLVMEVGGLITHGSVVAREYGIPAVVGVHQATERLKTGERIRLDGSTGTIQIIGEYEDGNRE